MAEPIRRGTIGLNVYDVRRYRPCIEGLFARIERWTNQEDPTDVFWRSISIVSEIRRGRNGS